MKIAGVIFVLGALGCGTSAAPPGATLDTCMADLIQNPLDTQARSLLPGLMERGDEQTMDSMRYFHNTGKAMMDHNYPSHRWIHPFLRGCRRIQEDDLIGAEREFNAARDAALDDRASPSAIVVAEESRLRLEELRRHR